MNNVNCRYQFECVNRSCKNISDEPCDTRERIIDKHNKRRAKSLEENRLHKEKYGFDFPIKAKHVRRSKEEPWATELYDNEEIEYLGICETIAAEGGALYYSPRTRLYYMIHIDRLIPIL